MMDSTVVVLNDSLRHLSQSLDSLREVVKTMSIQHDCWLHTLQGQTALYMLVTAALVAIVAAFNWVSGRAQIRDATKREFTSLSKKLEDRASALESEISRSNTELKGDVFGAVAVMCANAKDWSTAITYGMRSAVRAASAGKWTNANSRAKFVVSMLKDHSSEVKQRVEDLLSLRQQLDEISRTQESSPVLDLIGEALARFERAQVSPIDSQDHPTQSTDSTADKS